MKRALFKVTALASLIALSACATTPTGPMVRVMPGPNKPFEVFAQDQNACKAYAYSQVSGQAEQANNQAVGAAVLTTALGAALGAAVSRGGRGAGAGAATGAVVGTAIGAGGSNDAQYSIQRRYDIAYQQCMYAKGNQVPGFYPQSYGGPQSYGPPPSYGAPPPPPSSAPPPPY